MSYRECRCEGGIWTEQEVAAMPFRGYQDDGAGGHLALHTCPGCQCTFALESLRESVCPGCGCSDCACDSLCENQP